MTRMKLALKHLGEAIAVSVPFYLIALIHMANRVPGFTISTQFDPVEGILVLTGAMIWVFAFFRFKHDLGDYEETKK